MQIGQIISLTGDAIHVSNDGTTRPAAVNDIVNEGDQILLLGPNSSVLVVTPSGERLTLNQNGQLESQNQQKTEIEQLLSDDDFDISALPAPGAGPQETEPDSGSGEHGIGHFTPTLVSKATTSLLIDDAPLLAKSPAHPQAVPINNDFPQPFSEPTSRDEQQPWSNTKPRSLGIEQHAVTEDFIIAHQDNINHSLDLRPGSFETRYGTVDVSDDGAWRYLLNNDAEDIQSLGAGETVQESFVLNTRTGDFLDINITIHGSNDAPAIQGKNHVLIEEDHGDQFHTQQVSIDGKLLIADIDAGQSQFFAQDSIITPYGHASIKADGAWHYALHENSDFVQGLKEGQHVTDTFQTYTLDGTRHTIRIDIAGSNDKPILSGQNDGLIQLGQNNQTEGKIDIVDPDFGESTFQANAEIVGKYGTANLDASGHWQYTVDNTKLFSLPDSKKIYDVLNVYTEDGTRQDLVIKIVGSSSIEETTLSHADSLNLNSLLQEDSAAPSLDSLFGTMTSEWSASHINSGDALSLSLAGSTPQGQLPLSNHLDVT